MIAFLLFRSDWQLLAELFSVYCFQTAKSCSILKLSLQSLKVWTLSASEEHFGQKFF